MMLVVTPSPKSSESLFGYILRVSESNGYTSLSPILSIAGYKDLTIRSSKFDWKPLSKVLGNIDLSELTYSRLTNRLVGEIATKSPGHMRGVPGLWRLNAPQICTKCIQEKGYIEAHWDLACMVACPEHGNYAISHCHECNSPLKWSREGLLTCHCGADLKRAPVKLATEETVSAVKLFKGLFYEQHVSCHLTAKGSLDFDWNGLSFYQIVSLMRLLGKKYPVTPVTPVTPVAKNDHVINVEIFGEIFSNWPSNYHEYLKTVGHFSNNGDEQQSTLVKQYSSFYSAIKSNKNFKGISEILISEFVKFGFEVYGKAFVDERLKQRVIGKMKPRFLSPAQAARVTGMSPVTLKKWANNGLLESSKPRAGNFNKLVIDISNDAIKATADGKVLKKREASAYIGLPVSVLSYLERADIFRHEHKSKEKYGFHISDLDQLRQRILDLAKLENRNSSKGADTYSFCLLYTSPSPRDLSTSRMPSSA